MPCLPFNDGSVLTKLVVLKFGGLPCHRRHCAQYMPAFLQATEHSKEVHHLRSVQYYVYLLEGRESNAPARDPRGTQFKFGAEVHPENAQKRSKHKVATSATSQGALSDVSDGVSDDNNRDGKHSGDVDAGDSDVGYDSSVSEDAAGDNTEDESIGDDDTSHANAVGNVAQRGLKRAAHTTSVRNSPFESKSDRIGLR